MTPSSVLLIAVPIALLLAALALGAGERRARARRIRDALGSPRSRVDGTAAGDHVVLEGRLHVIEGPCARFEDGAPAAAATVETTGLAAVPDRLKTTSEADAIARVAYSVRASVLVLAVGNEQVFVEGPVEVVLGSEEADPHAPYRDLSLGVRERIAAACDRSALPEPGARGLVHGWPLFRSLRDGATVVAAGVIAKRSDGERSGYREQAPWTLTGEKDAPIQLAFVSAPRHHGAVSAIVRGVRPFGWAPKMVLAGVALGLFALLALTRRGPPAPTQSAPVEQQQHHHHHLADPAVCADLKKQHAAAVQKLAACQADSDCAVETRGGAYFDLEGCYRYKNPQLSRKQAKATAEAWLNEGCARSYEICPAIPNVMCKAGSCVERPPEPIPESWRREEVPGGFFFYLPPGVSKEPPLEEEPVVGQYRGGGMLITANFSQYESDADSDGAAMPIGGRAARVWKQERGILVQFEQSTPCSPGRCSHFAEGDKLALLASCETTEACEVAWLALQSVRFW